MKWVGGAAAYPKAVESLIIGGDMIIDTHLRTDSG